MSTATVSAQEWHIVKIALKKKTEYNDASDLLWALLAPRALVDSGLMAYTHDVGVGAGLAVGSYSAWPLLLGISGVGATVEDGLVYPNGGSVLIDNSPNSLGDERRFIDLLDRYTAIDQDVSIWQCRTIPTNDGPTTEFSQIWSAYVASVSVDGPGQTVSLQLGAERIPSKVLTLEVNTGDFATAPSESIGKILPIVFGEDVQVKPVLVTQDSTPTYAYATSLGTEHPTGGIQKYYVRDDAGKWANVASPAATTTLLYGVSGSFTGTPDPWASTYEFAVKLDYTPGSSTSYVINSGYISCYGDATYSPVADATVSFKIVEATSGTTPRPTKERVLRECTVYKSDYESELETATSFAMQFGFEKPLVVNSDRVLYLVIYNNDGTNDLKLNMTATASTVWYTPAGDPEFVYSSAVAFSYIYSFYGLKFTDSASSTANSQGLGYASYEVTYSSAASAAADSVDETDVTGLDYIVEIDGLKDDSGGSITSSASSIITAPHFIAKLVTQRWNGTSWGDTYITTSEHSGTHTALTSTTSPFYRKIQGRTTGRTTTRDLLAAIMRESYCTLTQFPSDYDSSSINTPLGVYAYGTNEASDAIFSDDDIQFVSYAVQGRESVINRVQMSYAPLLTNADFVDYVAQGGDRNYSGFIDVGYNDGGKGQAISAASKEVFGERPLGDNRYNFIKDSTSANGVALCILTDCEQPKEYVVFTVPFWKASTLHLLDLVTLQSAQLPAHFGTSVDARLPSYGGYEVELLSGRSWRRFKPYKARIYGLQYYFSEDGPVTVEITARLLTNQFDPSL